MSDATATFTALRPRLHGIAYRMLGSVAESEDLVQDIWLSWHGTDPSSIDNAEAWLVAATTRRAIDRLRSARARREHYVGIWLPEPVLTDEGTTPEDLEELASDVSVAFLTLLERLAPEARAAFLLREVFDTDYADIARMLGKSEAACRQLVHRAKAQVQDGRPRSTVTARERHPVLMRRFASALASGDLHAIRDMLAGDAVLMSDGGGKVNSFPEPMVGGARIAQLFYAPHLRKDRELRIELALVNGQWAVLRYFDDVLESVQSYETDGEKIVAVYVQRNPDKLARFMNGLGGFRADGEASPA
ncbi:RNA polymerase sigma-70 factor [Luteibacter aegosomatis]|uniref:RNA polymerase sigma-70 factor n=1 Tax=Luteibacter aegosomatis TaxID=2911537 RepID=UPI001FF73FB0|nr:RNA polymerase sigma-70 factor [Luteibacter aegosomatis]UPG87482.1 RNA polymerase sigma-70 factor [Luteibacter aegosomatis]